jgi:hypothetical protein
MNKKTDKTKLIDHMILECLETLRLPLGCEDMTSTEGFNIIFQTLSECFAFILVKAQNIDDDDVDKILKAFVLKVKKTREMLIKSRDQSEEKKNE